MESITLNRYELYDLLRATAEAVERSTMADQEDAYNALLIKLRAMVSYLGTCNELVIK